MTHAKATAWMLSNSFRGCLDALTSPTIANMQRQMLGCTSCCSDIFSLRSHGTDQSRSEVTHVGNGMIVASAPYASRRSSLAVFSQPVPANPVHWTLASHLHPVHPTTQPRSTLQHSQTRPITKRTSTTLIRTYKLLITLTANPKSEPTFQPPHVTYHMPHANHARQ